MMSFYQAGRRRWSPWVIYLSILCAVCVFSCSANSQGGDSGSSPKVSVQNRLKNFEPPKSGHRAPGIYWDTQQNSDAPVSLTASDGTGLELKSYDARAVVQGPLAFTELRLRFSNPENRQREGHFEITLPPGAAISRFAMKIHNNWQEAEVVERQRARQTYEEFLHQRQDPALLEKKAGNQFRARVFPIFPKEEKEIIISWSQETHRHPYTLHVAGLPKIEQFDVTIRNEAPGRKVKNHFVNKKLFTPKGNLMLIPARTPQPTGFKGLQSDDLRVVELTPQITNRRTPMNGLTVLFDTSASRALGFQHQITLAVGLIHTLQKQHTSDFNLTFACFDQNVQPIYRGPVSGFNDRIEAQIRKRGALGASNLSRAIRWAKKQNTRNDRILLITDAIVTAGTEDATDLKKQLAQLAKIGTSRLDVVVTGGIRDESLLTELVTDALPEAGVVLDGETPLWEMATRLLRQVRSEITVSTTGTEWVWPTTLKGVQNGDSFLVYMAAPQNARVKIKLDLPNHQWQPVAFKHVSRPLLERASAIAQIESVSTRLGEIKDVAEKRALVSQIVDLSIAHRVLSDFTALLVLETEWDYRRFKIDRTALSEILVVGEDGLQMMDRSDTALPIRNKPTQSMPKVARGRALIGEEGQMGMRDSLRANNSREIFGEDTALGVNPEMALGMLMGNQVGENFGYGGLGLKGVGRGGGGTGQGSIGLGNMNTIGHGGGGGSGAGYGRGAGGLGGRRGPAPRVRSGAVMVTGALSREVIRRIVRRHINEVKFCYERELVSQPDLEGRVTVQFNISETGAVTYSAIRASSLNNAQIESCITAAVRRWTFPEPDGSGSVTVQYPFQLTAPTRENDSIAHRPDLPPVFNQSNQKQIARKNRKRAVVTSFNGKLKRVMTQLREKQTNAAWKTASEWHRESPADLLSYVALGEVFEAKKMTSEAARAYGSIIDLYPSRADMRRMAGERLERLRNAGLALAIDTFKKAVAQRPDHPTGHRLYAWSLFRNGQYTRALKAMHKGIMHKYPSDRFQGVVTSLKDEAALMLSLWERKEAGNNAAKDDIQEMKKLFPHYRSQKIASTRFILHWESDANDVDLHVFDNHDNHAYYSQRRLPGGGRLADDVTTGYGPEFFTIEGTPRHTPYALQAHYYNRGPMGYGMGTLHVIQVDKKGNVTFDFRPFIIMNDNAYVGLGMVKG